MLDPSLSYQGFQALTPAQLQANVARRVQELKAAGYDSPAFLASLLPGDQQNAAVQAQQLRSAAATIAAMPTVAPASAAGSAKIRSPALAIGAAALALLAIGGSR